jgi:hypothetical protein
MQIREISKPVTAKALNESLSQKFGYKINFEQFSDVQLEDARNKLRTKISQIEMNESYDTLHDSQEYQKTRMFLDCVNQEIMERDEGKCPTCHHNPCDCVEESVEDTEKAEKKAELRKKVQAESIKQKAQQYRVPASWINSAIERMNLGESDEDELAAELTLRYDLSENVARSIVYLAEGSEDKAKVIMATKDMVDRITGWLEDTAAMKAEQLLELLDSIGETLGSDVAQQYNEQVKPALEAIYTALETSRQGLSAALATVSGEEAPMMGADPAMGATPGATPMPGEEPGMGSEEGDMGMAPEETPPGAEGDRMKRESVDYSRRLGQLLAQSKKK